VRAIAGDIRRLAPDAVVINMVEPIDLMTVLIQEALECDRFKVMGVGGLLSSTRLRHLVSRALGVSPREATALIIGPHHPSMTFLRDTVRVSAIPAATLLGDSELDRLIGEALSAGDTILEMSQRSTSYYAPSAAAAALVDAIVSDSKALLPVSVRCEGEYGVRGLAIGVPAFVVSNPLDIMCHVALRTTGFDLRRVIGMAGILDSTRFRFFVAEHMGCALSSVHAMVLGGHGDQMVPLPRLTTVGGVPITELMDADTIARLCERTRKGGAEVVALLKTGSAYYAPAASAAEMVEAIVTDRKHLSPCAAYLRGEYGIHDLFIGVPVILGRNGVGRIIELDLTDEERKELLVSADAVRNGVEELATFFQPT